ncbi:MAG: deoxyribodipyrimidine photo-lyase [Gemmataceae bacterium]
MIQPERIQLLNDCPVNAAGDFVLYWMQQSQRAECNHALEHAIERANDLDLPVVVLFGITDSYPEANARHYLFMLEGLRDAARALRQRGIQLVLRKQAPEQAAVELGQRAALVVVDRGYLRLQRHWRDHAADELRCPLIQVESDVVVPVEVASDKEEYAAATLRPKIHRHLKRFLVPLAKRRVHKRSRKLELPGLELDDPAGLLSTMQVDRSVAPVETFQGGTSEARRRLTSFLRGKLARYAERRNEPAGQNVSDLSPYLHFGQIAPLEVALKIKKSKADKASKESFLEELIVRRELSMNFVYYNQQYDEYDCLPEWARKTLDAHRDDPREYAYGLEDWEQARTHDDYWNAAQREMVATGKMHNYMRMYWGKKILEWTAEPEEAFRIALYLNNKYELDGRDANSFAGVAWCFGKHDRPWAERAIFGLVRYMNAAGLERKFDMAAYLERVNSLPAEQARPSRR